MAAVTGLTIVKRFDYRDDPNEEWSNQYHFKSAPPGDDASWRVLALDVINQEAQVIRPETVIIRAYGYDSDDPNADSVFQWDLLAEGAEQAGLLVGLTGTPLSGDQAAFAWWKTDRLARGKHVYLRKYIHGGANSSADRDALDPVWLTALETYATNMNGVHGGMRSRAHDASVILSGASKWVTTRTLKRRGKRPLAQ